MPGRRQAEITENDRVCCALTTPICACFGRAGEDGHIHHQKRTDRVAAYAKMEELAVQTVPATLRASFFGILPPQRESAGNRGVDFVFPLLAWLNVTAP